MEEWQVWPQGSNVFKPASIPFQQLFQSECSKHTHRCAMELFTAIIHAVSLSFVLAGAGVHWTYKGKYYYFCNLDFKYYIYSYSITALDLSKYLSLETNSLSNWIFL